MFDDFLERLAYLTPEQKPLWGKMTAQHMVEHLIWTLQVSSGKLTFECVSPLERLPALKRFLLSDKPMPQLFINPVIGETLVDLNYGSLNEAKEKLTEEILNYRNYFLDNPNSKPVHMIFGELAKEEWNMLHKKHFTLHFLQFGLTDT